jgi:hypothetical protein
LLDFLRFKLRIGQQPTVVNAVFSAKTRQNLLKNGANSHTARMRETDDKIMSKKGFWHPAMGILHAKP